MAKRQIAIDDAQYALLLKWAGDHIAEVPKGIQASPTWAAGQILKRYFNSQAMMRQVLKREESK
jgi:hypothetical protein